jgi:hypothetical protein
MKITASDLLTAAKAIVNGYKTHGHFDEEADTQPEDIEIAAEALRTLAFIVPQTVVDDAIILLRA